MDVALRPFGHLPSDFNAAQGRQRILALVSPTCAHCLAGIRLLREGLQEFPDSDTGLLILWVAMLPGDTDQVAGRVAGNLSPCPSVLEYWGGLPGWEIAAGFRSLLGLGPADATRAAWDVYLRYAPEAKWLNDPPAPMMWANNLVDRKMSGVPELSRDVVEGWLTATRDTSGPESRTRPSDGGRVRSAFPITDSD